MNEVNVLHLQVRVESEELRVEIALLNELPLGVVAVEGVLFRAAPGHAVDSKGAPGLSPRTHTLYDKSKSLFFLLLAESKALELASKLNLVHDLAFLWLELGLSASFIVEERHVIV